MLLQFPVLSFSFLSVSPLVHGSDTPIYHSRASAVRTLVPRPAASEVLLSYLCLSEDYRILF